MPVPKFTPNLKEHDMSFVEFCVRYPVVAIFIIVLALSVLAGLAAGYSFTNMPKEEREDAGIYNKPNQ